jgi:hypothetical protein
MNVHGHACTCLVSTSSRYLIGCCNYANYVNFVFRIVYVLQNQLNLSSVSEQNSCLKTVNLKLSFNRDEFFFIYRNGI